MGMMYSWATKEYLLWEMTIGQIIMYHTNGSEIKYGKEEKKKEISGLANMSEDKVRQLLSEYKKQYGDI